MSGSPSKKYWRKFVLPFAMFSALHSGQSPVFPLLADERTQTASETQNLAGDFIEVSSEEIFTDVPSDNIYDTMLVGHPGRRFRLGGRRDDCEPVCEPECEESIDDLYDKMLSDDESKSDSPDSPDTPTLPSDPSNIPPPSAQNFNFNAPPVAMASASRNVPAMLGDFFGGGGGFSATVVGVAITSEATADRVVDLNNFDSMGRAVFATSFLENFAGIPAVNWTSTDPVVDTTFDPGTGPTPTPGIIATPLDPSWNDDAGYDRFRVILNDPILTNDPNGTYTIVNEAEAVLDDPGGIIAGDPDDFITPLDRSNISNTTSDSMSADSDLFTVYYTTTTVPIIQVNVPIAATAGRVKLSEGSSPIPRDRILFNYGFFNNVRLRPGDIDVNRFTPGFEKTFLEGNASLELRVPFATTLDSDINGSIFATGVEYGDLTATLKYLLASTETWALSAGFGMSFPTSDDISYSLPNGTNVFNIESDAAHMMPYIGGTYAPTQRAFVQGMVQVDTPLDGNDVQFNANPNDLDPTRFGEHGLRTIGKLNDATFLYADFSSGYWLYRSDDWDMATKDGVTGVAGMLELHYNTTLNEFDKVTAPIANSSAQFQLGDNSKFEQLNAVVGGLIEMNADTSLSLGYAFPLSSERVFQGEFRCNFTHLFGGSSARNGADYLIRNRSL